jgi:hypothetical protein
MRSGNMNAANRFFAGITLGMVLLGAGVAWGDSSVVGGNVIVNRPVVDSAEKFYLVDTNHPVNADGRVDQWEIHAGSLAPVQLVIYRQQGGAFFVVDWSEPVFPALGYNSFALPRGHKMKVKAGDFVGAYFPETGSVSFSLDPPFSYNLGNLTGTMLYVFGAPPNGDGSFPIPFADSSNRHYSIRVLGKRRQQEDTCPVNIAGVAAQPDVLWPPNHQMVPVTVAVYPSSRCSAPLACEILEVSSNEPENGLGDGDTAPDWEISTANPLTVNLRAERAGTGGGRVYTVIGECTDAENNDAPWRTTVTVPHDQGKK